MKEYQEFISRAIGLIIGALLSVVLILIIGNYVGAIGLGILFVGYFTNFMYNIKKEKPYLVLNLIFLAWTFFWFIASIL